jgi:hypothetical protein
MEKVGKFVYFYIKFDFLRALQIWEIISSIFPKKRYREHCLFPEFEYSKEILNTNAPFCDGGSTVKLGYNKLGC